jgi:hypothetical protein
VSCVVWNTLYTRSLAPASAREPLCVRRRCSRPTSTPRPVESRKANFFSTDHHVYRGLLRSWLLTPFVLLQRAHLDLATAKEPNEDFQQDLATYDKSMPT